MTKPPRMTDAEITAEAARHVAEYRASTDPHPWYLGGCDALGPDGTCAECLKLQPADPPQASSALERYIAAQSPPVRAGLDAYRRAIRARKDWHRAVTLACEAAIQAAKP